MAIDCGRVLPAVLEFQGVSKLNVSFRLCRAALNGLSVGQFSIHEITAFLQGMPILDPHVPAVRISGEEVPVSQGGFRPLFRVPGRVRIASQIAKAGSTFEWKNHDHDTWWDVRRNIRKNEKER